MTLESPDFHYLASERWADDARLSLSQLHSSEVDVCSGLVAAASRPMNFTDAERWGFASLIRRYEGDATARTGTRVVLSDGQRAAVEAALTSPVMVLTGGPGCGKTFATEAIVHCWRAMGLAVGLCAPTGALKRPAPPTRLPRPSRPFSPRC